MFPLQPYKISSLVLHPLEPGSFLVLVLTQYRVLTTWFTLKAVTEGVATEWMKTITSAQVWDRELIMGWTEIRTPHSLGHH